MLKVTYLFHSGFLVETNECAYIFDYYKHGLEEIELDSGKPVIVFASHFHADHYDPDVFDILKTRGILYSAVLAKDIKPSRYPEGIDVTKAYAGNAYELPTGARVETLLSTDSGVAYILEVGGYTIYHVSMTEQQRRQMRGSFTHEINKLRGRRIDAAFVPLDPHLGDDYASGALALLNTADVRALWPMHYWEQPEMISRFVSEHPEYAAVVRNTETTHAELIM